MSEGDIAAFDRISQGAARLREQLGKVIVGQDDTVGLLTVAMLCGGHTLIIGVPGLAKTLLVRSLAKCLGWEFKRIQFTPDMMPSDVIGTQLIQEDGAGGGREFKFVKGPIFSNLVLADEINRTPPRTQAALLEAMAEKQVTAGGGTMRLDRPFVVVATQNPIEQEGTYPLPEAQLDRFMFSLNMEYPDLDQEKRIVNEREPDGPIDVEIEAVFSKDQSLQISDLIKRMPVSEYVSDYAVQLARGSRPSDDGDSKNDSDIENKFVNKYVAWGAGPRAGQYLVLGGKALAAIEGEPAPSCDHIRRIAPAVLNHRIVINYSAVGQGISSADVVNDLLERVKEGG